MPNHAVRVALCLAFILGIHAGCNRAWKAPRGKATSDFALLDQDGEYRRLSRYEDSKLVVLYSYGIGCPIARQDVPRLRELAKRHSTDVSFLLLDASPQDTRAKVKADAKDLGIELPILIDSAQLVARTLQIETTAQVVVLEPKGLQILWRGHVDDRVDYGAQKPTAAHEYLADALDALLRGREPKAEPVHEKGCALTSVLAREQLTYTHDIAPILRARCADCHKVGGMAPWAMDRYETVKGWTAMMRRVVLTKRMPPWLPDSSVLPLKHDLSLRDDEASRLVQWIDAGAPRGEGADPFARDPLPPDVEWPLGTPDIIVDGPSLDVPATGVLPIKYMPMPPLDIPHDAWVSAIQLSAGTLGTTARQVLHHGLLRTGTFVLAGLVASTKAETEFGDDVGYCWPKGRYPLALELHVTTIGKASRTQAKVGVYLRKERTPPKRGIGIVAWTNSNFIIPPNAKRHYVKGVLPLPDAIDLLSFQVHMHYRGYSMRCTAIYPDDTQEELFSIPYYDFNYQSVFSLETPKHLPAGTKLSFIASFDNSHLNRNNPDPSKQVTFGQQSWEEMVEAHLFYTQPVDEKELAKCRGLTSATPGVASP